MASSDATRDAFPFHGKPLQVPSQGRCARVARDVRTSCRALGIPHHCEQAAVRKAREVLMASHDDVDAVAAGIQHAVAAKNAADKRGAECEPWPVPLAAKVFGWLAILGLVITAVAFVRLLGQLRGWWA